MGNVETAGQRLINLKIDSRLLDKLDDYLRRVGGDRSGFIRDAIVDALRARGVIVPPEWAAAPSRVGKGGRRTHRDYQPSPALIQAALNDAAAAIPPKTATPSEKVTYLRKKKSKP